MKAITIPVKGWGRGQKCSQCRRTIKPGEVGIVHRLLSGNTRRYGGYESALWWHRTCIEEILTAAPVGAKDYTTLFEELKEQAQSGELDY